ncbi:hypothetical protein D3C77_538770 [compost metagenome]
MLSPAAMLSWYITVPTGASWGIVRLTPARLLPKLIVCVLGGVLNSQAAAAPNEYSSAATAAVLIRRRSRFCLFERSILRATHDYGGEAL